MFEPEQDDPLRDLHHLRLDAAVDRRVNLRKALERGWDGTCRGDSHVGVDDCEVGGKL